MADEKKKPEDETAENNQTENQPDTPNPNEKPPENKPTEAPENDENSKGKIIPDKPEKPPEGNSDGNTNAENEPKDISSEPSEEDKLREENLRLKTQLEAMKTGFKTAVIEDAVTLAESMAKRDNIDIKKALQEIAKKYPEWKSESKDKSKTGFRVGGGALGKSPNTGSADKPTAQKRWNKFNQ